MAVKYLLTEKYILPSSALFLLGCYLHSKDQLNSSDIKRSDTILFSSRMPLILEKILRFLLKHVQKILCRTVLNAQITNNI